MPAPLGSKNALGNSGGGRPSAYQERANAELLEQIFLGEISLEEAKKKIKKGKFSIKERYLERALGGNVALLSQVFGKFFPDKSSIKEDSNQKIEQTHYIITREDDIQENQHLPGTENPVASEGAGQQDAVQDTGSGTEGTQNNV